MANNSVSSKLGRKMAEKFHLEINSLDEFIRFVTIIRGDELDSNKINALVKELNDGAQQLHEAVEKGK